MGIKTSSARLLAHLKREGECDLRSVCMLGRQELCMTKRQIKALRKDYGDVLQSDFEQEVFSENFLKALGAEQIHSLDASNFEGLTPAHFRIAAQSPQENDIFIKCMQEWLSL